MAGEDDKYFFPETLNQQERFLGLPLDEFIVVVPLVVTGILLNMSTVLSIVAGLLWWLPTLQQHRPSGAKPGPAGARAGCRRARSAVWPVLLLPGQ